jgi:hypothetical protein
MGRAILAVIVAEVVWTVLWLGGSAGAQSLWPETIRAGEPLTHTGALVGYIVYSVGVSVLAGYVAAAMRRDDPMRTVWVFAWIQLAIGVGVEVSGWSLAPAWYHLAFLALLVPAIVWGGTLRAGRRSAGLVPG